MQRCIVIAGFLSAVALAAPTPGGNDPYANVDWSKVDYSNVDWSKVDWSKVDYGNGGSTGNNDGKDSVRLIAVLVRIY